MLLFALTALKFLRIWPDYPILFSELFPGDAWICIRISNEHKKVYSYFEWNKSIIFVNIQIFQMFVHKNNLRALAPNAETGIGANNDHLYLSEFHYIVDCA